ncbi:hypothetical protein RB594_009904 [Gaeumannomyces avenae]
MKFSVLAASATFGAALAVPFHDKSGSMPSASVPTPSLSVPAADASKTAPAIWTVTPTGFPTGVPTGVPTGAPASFKAPFEVSSVHHLHPAAPTGPPTGSPAPHDSATCIREAVVLVKTFKEDVHKELLIVKTLVSGPAEKLEEKIVAITSRVEECHSKFETLLAGVKPEELGAEDRETILTLLSELKEVVEEVEACIVDLGKVLTAKVLSVLLPKIAALKECLGALIAPLLNIAFAICALVKNDAIVAKIAFVASSLENCLAKFLSPVLAHIGKFLL